MPKEPCSIVGCTNPSFGRGWCSKHYARWQRHGDPNITGRTPPRTNKYDGQLCDVKDCVRGASKLGLCNMHYARMRSLGNTGEAASRKMSRDGACMVPDCDRPVVAKRLCGMHRMRLRNHGDLGDGASLRPGGSRVKKRDGYIAVHSPDHPNANGDGYVLEHRLEMSKKLGRALSDRENVHHINGVRDDNRPENLELWVKPQPAGRRVSDLVEWVISEYPEHVRAALDANPQLQMLIEQP